jgi:hypothetical protein
MKKIFYLFALLFFLFFVSTAKAQMIWASNSTGGEKTTFYTNETIYLTSNKIITSAISVRIYIVNDNNTWANGTVLNDVRGSYTEKSTNDTGYFNSEPIWTSPSVGKYDIVVDINKDGIYNNSFQNNDYVDSLTTTGFEVLAAPYPTLTVSLGSNTPANHNWNASDTSENVMIQMKFTSGSYEGVTINSIGLKASGTGDDKNGISIIRLILDSNNNGVYDSSDSLIGYSPTSPPYLRDDTFATINLQNGYVLTANSNVSMLITYTMSKSVSPGDTFSFQVASVTAVGSLSGQSFTVSGTPISSAVKTVISSVTTTSTTASTTESTTSTTAQATTSTIPTTTTISDQGEKSNYMMIAIAITVAVTVGVIAFLFFRTRLTRQTYEYKWKQISVSHFN